jgi:uncharacterized membrane protein
MEIAESMESLLATAISILRPTTEAIGALWVTVGVVVAFFALLRAHFDGEVTSFTAIRLRFSRYLSLALEFQLASDILSTAIAPSWQELGKLGVTAVIRTALNYFLSREMREYREKEMARSSGFEASAAFTHEGLSPVER